MTRYPTGIEIAALCARVGMERNHLPDKDGFNFTSISRPSSLSIDRLADSACGHR